MRRRPAKERVAGPDVNIIRPATREETLPIVMGALAAIVVAVVICLGKHFTLLYGDAVAHLGIARRILDSREPGWSQLGSVWLPLPHVLMMPLVGKMEWWQNGMAGTWPSMVFYIAGVVGFYRLARRMMVNRWAVAATAFYGLNANLLYLSTTAMTEPLFLALTIWMVLSTVECVAALRADLLRTARRKMWLAGVLIAAAVLTRYDGWVLGAAVWCVLAWEVRRSGTWPRLGSAFGAFTLLTVAAPVWWLCYNAHYFHDPLDFLRGPYSAVAIERRTTPTGAGHYPGWHDALYALKLYVRTAQADAAWRPASYVIFLAALEGLFPAWVKKLPGAAWLLWIPLPFYVYSVAYGSVPIFIPALWPHSYYNSRYGVELLPALALFSFIAIAWTEEWVRGRGGPGAKLSARLMQPLMILLIAVNVLLMIRATPLVLKEAQVNASTRVPFEHALAETLRGLPHGTTVLMASGDHIGALEEAGVPLRLTVNEGDYFEWQGAMQEPAKSAAYVIAVQGDPVAAAVKAHPEGLTEMDIVCSTGQACAKVYKSDAYGAH